jgi:AbrB family looped-hinge helix DNA binding protein
MKGGRKLKNNHAEVNSKGHLVLPKEIRHQFHLVPGSKVRIEVEGDRIVLIPQALVDAMEKIIVDTLKKVGLKPDTASLSQYQAAMKLALANMANDAKIEKKNNPEQAPKKTKR